MSRNKTTRPPRHDPLVTAAEWFGGGQRIWYDPQAGRVLTEQEAAATPGALRVFERVAAAGQDGDTVWLTLLTTSEHAGLLAAAIRDIAARHGVATAATANR
jgi:hypothetical protein